MRAALYARHSTDRQDESSIRDQVRICTEYVTRQGWTVAAQFADEGISGAAIGNRPGILKMMQSAMVRGFDVLLVVDLSRLARSQADLPKAIDRLNARGIRVIGVQNGYDSARKGHKLQAGMEGIIGEAFREMVSDRTHAALETRAKDGRSTGGSEWITREDQALRIVDCGVVGRCFTRQAVVEDQGETHSGPAAIKAWKAAASAKYAYTSAPFAVRNPGRQGGSDA